ncbi:unnamed protein product, partial [Citrullus colocynthis]
MSTSTPIQCRLYGTGNGVLEVQLRYFERTISDSPVAGHPPRILHETPPTPFHNARFSLYSRQLQDPLFYIRQFLSSLHISPTASEVIAGQIVSYIVQMFNGNRERNFYIIAEVDFVRVILMEEQSIAGVLEAAVERVWRLKWEEKEGLGDCSICWDESGCEKREVIRIPCGHVYHESCIFKWLKDHSSCPLPLQVKLLLFHEILGLVPNFVNFIF